MSTSEHLGHGTDDIAYHVEWGFRREAVIWVGGRPAGLNFHPIATELYDWLLRKGQFPVFAEVDRAGPNSYRNPYTYHCSALAALAAATINDSYAIATSEEPLSPLDAEVARVRVFSEEVLYVARVCESLIKQLLHVTQIPERYYAIASLGHLLSTGCRGCRASGKQRHNISLLGSLAHRYQLCHQFEYCLMEHLKIVGRHRNLKAAHSGTSALNVRSATESRSQLMSDAKDLGDDFVHMLSHIRELETRMTEDLEHAVLDGWFEPRPVGGSPSPEP